MEEKRNFVGWFCAMTVQAYGDAKVEERGEVLRNCFRLLFPDVLDYLLLSSL